MVRAPTRSEESSSSGEDSTGKENSGTSSDSPESESETQAGFVDPNRSFDSTHQGANNLHLADAFRTTRLQIGLEEEIDPVELLKRQLDEKLRFSKQRGIRAEPFNVQLTSAATTTTTTTTVSYIHIQPKTSVLAPEPEIPKEEAARQYIQSVQRIAEQLNQPRNPYYDGIIAQEIDRANRSLATIRSSDFQSQAISSTPHGSVIDFPQGQRYSNILPSEMSQDDDDYTEQELRERREWAERQEREQLLQEDDRQRQERMERRRRDAERRALEQYEADQRTAAQAWQQQGINENAATRTNEDEQGAAGGLQVRDAPSVRPKTDQSTQAQTRNVVPGIGLPKLSQLPLIGRQPKNPPPGPPKLYTPAEAQAISQDLQNRMRYQEEMRAEHRANTGRMLDKLRLMRQRRAEEEEARTRARIPYMNVNSDSSDSNTLNFDIPAVDPTLQRYLNEFRSENETLNMTGNQRDATRGSLNASTLNATLGATGHDTTMTITGSQKGKSRRDILNKQIRELLNKYNQTKASILALQNAHDADSVFTRRDLVDDLEIIKNDMKVLFTKKEELRQFEKVNNNTVLVPREHTEMNESERHAQAAQYGTNIAHQDHHRRQRGSSEYGSNLDFSSLSKFLKFQKDSDFKTFFTKLFRYGEPKGFTHKEYHDCLYYLLPNEHTQDLEHLEGRPLQEIVDYFVTLHTKPDLPQQALDKIRKFKRKPQENIKACMKRFDMLLHKSRLLYPAHERDVRNESKLIDALFRFVGPKTELKLKREMFDSYKSGDHLSYSELLEMAFDYEICVSEFGPKDIDAPIAELQALGLSDAAAAVQPKINATQRAINTTGPSKPPPRTPPIGNPSRPSGNLPQPDPKFDDPYGSRTREHRDRSRSPRRYEDVQRSRSPSMERGRSTDSQGRTRFPERSRSRERQSRYDQFQSSSSQNRPSSTGTTEREPRYKSESLKRRRLNDTIDDDEPRRRDQSRENYRNFSRDRDQNRTREDNRDRQRDYRRDDRQRSSYSGRSDSYRRNDSYNRSSDRRDDRRSYNDYRRDDRRPHSSGSYKDDERYRNSRQPTPHRRGRDGRYISNRSTNDSYQRSSSRDRENAVSHNRRYSEARHRSYSRGRSQSREDYQSRNRECDKCGYLDKKLDKLKSKFYPPNHDTRSCYVYKNLNPTVCRICVDYGIMAYHYEKECKRTRLN